MRIIAGAAKGRRLVVPAGEDVRPTADRVKEALFSSLQPMLSGAHVLDLFAGTGALGLEALSRGAASVVFVERARRSLEALRRNIDAVGLPGTTVVAGDVLGILGGDADAIAGPFDLVLIDPPYRLPKAALTDVLAALPGRLADEGVVVLEASAREGTPRWPPGLRPDTSRRYGDTAVHLARGD